MERETANIEAAKNVLDTYVARNGGRKTFERHRLLEAVVAQEKHFTVEELTNYMENVAHVHVSKGTVYSNLELMVKAHLLVRCQFGMVTQYEFVYDQLPHSHMYCTACGKVTEFETDDLAPLVENKLGKFKPSFASLTVYGTCGMCRRKKINKT